MGTSGENLANMVSHVIGSHQIPFREVELPIEGVMNNCTLYITVKCTNKFVARVLIDNGSGLNICPLSTLTQLNHDVGKIHQSHMNVRAFDGSQRETMREVDLGIQMGPAEFVTEFQVMGNIHKIQYVARKTMDPCGRNSSIHIALNLEVHLGGP